MSRRETRLRTAVTNFLKTHADWVKDSNRSTPDEIYWDAVDEMLDVFAAGDIPADCRDLADKVERFARECEAFDSRQNVDNLYPDSEFWAAREAIEAAFKASGKKELPPLESMEELRKADVPDWQIAKIYGLVDDSGNPLPHLVEKELKTPGSVIGKGTGWVDPRLRDQKREEAADDAGEDEAMEAKGRRAAKEAAPCPESPLDLWEQGVPVQQAAKMLRRPLAEVVAEFKRFDDEAKVKSDSATDGEDEDTDLADEPAGDATDIDQQIRSLAAEGLEAGAIAQRLGIDGRKVAGILRRRVVGA